MYMTDALAAMLKADVRYIDAIRPQPEDTRSAEEIIEHIKNKLASE